MSSETGMTIERTHGYVDGTLVHHLVARDADRKFLVALPKFPAQPGRWWNGRVNAQDRRDIAAALKDADK